VSADKYNRHAAKQNRGRDNRNNTPQRQAKKPLKQGMEARLVATTLITRVIDDRRNLDALCDKQHGLSAFLSLDGRDRGLARAIAITALRNRNAIDFALSKLWDRPPPKKARFLHHSLHVAATQILFLDLPDSAAVDIAVSAIGDDERTTRFRSMANAVLRRMVREKDSLIEKLNAKPAPFPKWFEQTLRKDYGRDKTALIAAHTTQESLVDLTVKSDANMWAEKLGGFVLPTGSVRLTNSDAIDTLDGFEDGEWWVQDAAAGLPAKLINVEKGARVLELCAAPGGKTAQICHAGYDVTALDISKPRLARLEQNLARLGFSAKLVEADILEWQPENLFDAVLLDAPCSSTGTIRRHPDILWTRTPEEIRELAELQFKLIEKARSFIKPDGVLVFSNCSMFKQEGEDLLPRIKAQFEDLEFSQILPQEVPGLESSINGQGALRTLPFHLSIDENITKSGMDGFFACRYIKK